MARPEYPKDMREFLQKFGTEADCIEYLIQCRWPDGFVCPKCSSVQSSPNTHDRVSDAFRNFSPETASDSRKSTWLSQPGKHLLLNGNPSPEILEAFSSSFSLFEASLFPKPVPQDSKAVSTQSLPSLADIFTNCSTTYLNTLKNSSSLNSEALVSARNDLLHAAQSLSLPFKNKIQKTLTSIEKNKSFLTQKIIQKNLSTLQNQFLKAA